MLILGTKDKIHEFHCDISSMNFGSAAATSLELQFIGLMMGTRQCYVLLSSPGEDLVVSVTAQVEQPLPMLPSVACYDRHTVVDSETNTLHLSSYSGDTVQEDITVHPSNTAFENALIQVTKWELSEHELKQRVRTESLQYAALTSNLSRLCVDDLVINDDGKAILFTVGSTNSKEFNLPPVVNIFTNGKTNR